MEQSNRETNMRFKKQTNEYCSHFRIFAKCGRFEANSRIRTILRMVISWFCLVCGSRIPFPRLHRMAYMANIPGNVCKTFGTCSKRLPVTLRCPSNLARISRLLHGRPRAHPGISRGNWNFWGSWSFGGGDGIEMVSQPTWILSPESREKVTHGSEMC